VRSQLAALRIDDLKFLLDTEGEAEHGGDNTSVDSRESLVDSLSRQSQSTVSVGSRQCQSTVISRSGLMAFLMQYQEGTWREMRSNGWRT
jgi:hypothetical protein